MSTAMESDMDHEQVAWLMDWWYGPDAGPYAELQMNWSLKQGELKKHEDWKRVVYEIVKLQSKPLPENNAVR